MKRDNIIDKLMSNKRENLVSQEDFEKYELVEELVADKEIFFHLDIDTALGILEFLDVKEEDLSKTYLDLISPECYLENVPQVRILDSSKK